MAERRRISWLSWLMTYVIMCALYLLFTSTITKVELMAGLGAAVVATFAAGVFGIACGIGFKPTVREVLEAWRLPYYAFQGTWELFKALAKQLFTSQGADSLLRAVPFDVGGEDPHSVARRTLAVTYTTLTPNFVVLGIVHKQSLMLYHQVLSGDVLQMTINLGARP